MRRLLIFGMVALLLAPGLSAASTLTRFGTGGTEAQASLRLPGCNDTVNITLPVACHVLEARFNVSTVLPNATFPSGPREAAVLLNDTVLYSFNGTGYGGLGRQTVFRDQNATTSFDLGSGGGNGRTFVRLPKTAQVLNATLNLSCSGPERTFELWSREGSDGEAFVAEARAGDVNNDGYDDFIVGASMNSSFHYKGGVAYLFLGGPTPDPEPDVIFTGNHTDQWFASFISGLGDLNGDGYDDIATFSTHDPTGIYAGQVNVFFGGDPMDNVSDIVFIGNTTNQRCGFQIAGDADVNGDGVNDLIFVSDMDGGTKYGQISVYFGGSKLNSTADLVINSPVLGNLFYVLPLITPDLNGDGCDDIVVGAPKEQVYGTNTGKVYVYFGGQNMDNVSDIEIAESVPGTFYGYSVNSAGDVNGDGYEELIVSAVEDWTDMNATGRAIIYYGGPTFDTQPDIIFNTTQPMDWFGSAACTAGDVNADGFGDVVVSAYANTTNGVNAGAVYLYYGAENMDNVSDYVVYGNVQDRLGVGSCFMGDIDSDGHDDFSVSAFNRKDTVDHGRVSILFKWVSGLLDPALTVGSGKVWSRTGYYNGTSATADIGKALNDRLKNMTATVFDGFGNSFVDVPLDFSARCDGRMTLGNLSVVYAYTARSIDFSQELMSYILAHASEKDANGNITVPLKVRSSTPGQLRLCDLRIGLDEAPGLSSTIPDMTMDEDSVGTALVDLHSHFIDDYEPAGNLTYRLVSHTNGTIVNVSLAANRYISLDALNGTLNDNWTGTVDIVVECSDRWNTTTRSNSFRVTVRNVPDPPILTSIPPLNATAGVLYSYQVLALDGDLDPVTFSLPERPPDMTIDPRGGLVTWTPGAGGNYPVSVMATDGVFDIYQNFTIFVPNQFPLITSSPNNTAIATLPYEYLVNASDADGDMLVYSLVSEIPGMTIDSVNGNISWTPVAPGDYTIRISVVDGKGGETFQEYRIHVYEKIEPKMEFVTLPEMAKVEGTLSVSGKVVNGSLKVEKVQYRLDSGEWVDLEGTEDWEITLDTTAMKNGVHKLEIRVYDGQEYTDLTTRTFSVDNPVEEEDESPFPTLLVVIIAGLAVAAGGLFLWKGRRPPDEEE